jgi:excisionase family DNA binding protein
MSRTVAITEELSPAERRMPHLLKPAEVAAILRVTPRTVQRYAKEGRLERVKLGRRLSRYTAASVEHLISSENTQSPRTATPGSAQTPNTGRSAGVGTT